ncbi:MAG TPA: response regulator [Rhizomicrobium sp.]|nr:response regulator [Rhizomicrobium sp.]
MQRLTYDTADVLVYDPVAANRNATRASLYMLGFRRIETVATLEAFAEYIFKTPPDLVLCEVQGAGAQLCDLIQNLRQGAGENPFIVVIVTAWDNSNGLVNMVLNSGADDLLLRPFSVTQLGQRVRVHIERRKGFVITTDYIGPDRRRDGNRGSNIELYQPPNSLKLKAADGLSGEEVAARLDGELRTAREVFGSEKLRRDAYQICVLWRLLQGYGPGVAQYDLDLAKLTGLTQSVSSRAMGTDQAAAVQWCDEILSAIDGLNKGVDRNASLHLLGKAALHLNEVFDPNTPANERLSQIDATVAIIHARQAVEMAS